jgi:hypothetical protein
MNDTSTQKTAYDRYQQRLHKVSSEQWKATIIKYLIISWPEWKQLGVWKTIWSRFDPDSHDRPYLSLLLQQESCSWHMCLIEISLDEPVNDSGLVLLNDDVLGWIKIRRFPEDPVLTTLPAVISQCQDNIEILRYRPYKRCTFRYQEPDSQLPVFGKLFADQRGQNIHIQSQSLWQASDAGQLTFQVATPISWDSATNTVWQAAIQGDPLVDQLFSATGAETAKRIGLAAASLPTSQLKPVVSFGGVEQMQRSLKYAKELARRLPDQRDSLTALMHQLHRIHADHHSFSRLKPIHGAPHAHQWLECGDQLGLVDFDRYCLGDPELDAATFIGEMDFEDRATVPVDELNAVFLDAYQSVAGKLDARLLQAYRSHKRLAKALKAARSIRSNGEHKAKRHLAFAHQALKETSL